MKKASRILTSFSLLLILSTLVDSATYNWTVERVPWSPDGVLGTVIAINGGFPGPTIRASVGEKLVISVTNNLKDEGLSIHWHGIRQFGTAWADGAANISQCPTFPGATFTYEFTVDKAGTYFYHGHNRMIRTDGLYGMLIVEDKDNGTVGSLRYDGELEILLSDWWHKTSSEQETELQTIPMTWIGEPNSLLINGRGQSGCSLAGFPACNLTGDEQNAPDVLRVEPGKTYRVRVASATSLSSLSFAIENHPHQVVEADGNLVNPFEVDNSFIYPGQTYSFLIKANQDSKRRYWISAGVVARKPNTTQGLTVLSYDTNKALALPTTLPPQVPLWNDTKLSIEFAGKIHAGEGTPKPPAKAGQRIYLLNTQNLIDGRTKWAINNYSLVLSATPYLGAIKYNVSNAFDPNSPPRNFSDSYDVMQPPPYLSANLGNGMYVFPLGQTVDVILQNANAIAVNKSETHPWHLHGHDFWVMGYGEGRFSDENERGFNVEDPPLRNTEVVFPFGWTALRFVADNPGVWAFHCHVEAHMDMGMGVVFAEGLKKIVKDKGIPKEGLRCGGVN